MHPGLDMIWEMSLRFIFAPYSIFDVLMHQLTDDMSLCNNHIQSLHREMPKNSVVVVNPASNISLDTSNVVIVKVNVVTKLIPHFL